MRLDVGGTRLWFDVEGAALVPDGPAMRARPTVVLLHGGPGSYDHSYFKPDFGRLAEAAQVVYLDLPGHGRSDWGDPASWSFELCADAVRGFCDALEIARPVVLGHSLGGIVAIVYAARHPEHARALVLQSTMARFDLARVVDGFRRAGGDEVAAIAARLYSGEPAAPEELARFRSVLAPGVERGRIVANLELGAHGLVLLREVDLLPLLARVECPTLVCVGELDPVTPVAAARELAGGLTSAAVQVEVVADAGHFPWLDAPDRYWPVVTGFVARAAGA
jgi:proline iminopeptidase